MKSCRACRLGKCLLEGMDPTMVEAEQSAELSQFIQSLYKRREFLQQQNEKICNMDTEIKTENDENYTSEERNEVIDLFRTMPHFSMLDPKDQAILLSFVAIPLIYLNARFYSSKTNSPIVKIISNSSFSPLYLYYKNPFYVGDKTIQTLSESLYVKSMELFNKLKLTDEEFLLVRALISSHSAVNGLSDAGRRTLQHLSEHYANLLMHYLRTNYGNIAGVHRYAELVHLAESVFFNAERHREFFTYLAMVTDQGRFHAAIPPIFTPMILHGTLDE
ncbi:hypothetical protein niasHT_001348 [Heterodera trifolii]|uniref:NR LBD domain-containing protein n=1 Tax=Heterodera trifolii TaxID=157864 RepID=A0ABD2LMY8_9BILA